MDTANNPGQPSIKNTVGVPPTSPKAHQKTGGKGNFNIKGKGETGYICKRCDGAAPVGIGYVVQGWRGVADKSRNACDCGYSVKPEAEGENPMPWVVVTNPGTDEEDIWADFPTHRAAVAALKDAEEGADVMRRLNDGTLTTEF